MCRSGSRRSVANCSAIDLIKPADGDPAPVTATLISRSLPTTDCRRKFWNAPRPRQRAVGRLGTEAGGLLDRPQLQRRALSATRPRRHHRPRDRADRARHVRPARPTLKDIQDSSQRRAVCGWAEQARRLANAETLEPKDRKAICGRCSIRRDFRFSWLTGRMGRTTRLLHFSLTRGCPAPREPARPRAQMPAGRRRSRPPFVERTALPSQVHARNRAHCSMNAALNPMAAARPARSYRANLSSILVRLADLGERKARGDARSNAALVKELDTASCRSCARRACPAGSAPGGSGRRR